MAVDEDIKNKILEMLLQDSRSSFRTIAAGLGISTTTVSRIINEFEKQGVILGYTTLVDWNKLGYESMLCILISILPGSESIALGSAIRKIPGIKQVFYTTGETTFSAVAVCRNNKEAAAVLERLRQIKGVDQVVGHTVLKIF